MLEMVLALGFPSTHKRIIALRYLNKSPDGDTGYTWRPTIEVRAVTSAPSGLFILNCLMPAENQKVHVYLHMCMYVLVHHIYPVET